MEMQLREAIGFGSRSFFSAKAIPMRSFSRWNFCLANRLFTFTIRSAIQKDPRPFVM